MPDVDVKQMNLLSSSNPLKKHDETYRAMQDKWPMAKMWEAKDQYSGVQAKTNYIELPKEPGPRIEVLNNLARTMKPKTIHE